MNKILVILASFVVIIGFVLVVFDFNQKNDSNNKNIIEKSYVSVDSKQKVENQASYNNSFESRPNETKSVIESPKKIDKLINTLKDKANSAETRIDAANKLIGIQAKESFEPLDEIVKNDSEEIRLRYKIARGFGVLDDERAVPTLSELLSDSLEDQHLRIISALALGKIGGDNATQALLDSLYDKDASIRFKVLQALESINNPEVAVNLIDHLKDPDKYVRANALYALGELGDSSYVPFIKDVLDNTEDGFIKIGCIDALGKIGGEEALIILNDYKEHPNQLVRLNTEKALQVHQ